MGWPKPDGCIGKRLSEAAAGEIVFLVGETEDGAYLGHAFVRWRSHYSPFREEDIPEVQDLNVITSVRRQGVASLLLDEAERRIADCSNRAGIGVGLHAAYGPAQRLYVRRGYVPDGTGAVHDNKPLAPGSLVRVDDDLVLHLIKLLWDSRLQPARR